MTFGKPPFRDPKTFWQPGMTTGFSTLAMAMTRPYGSLMVVPQFLEMMIILLKCARFSGKFMIGLAALKLSLANEAGSRTKWWFSTTPLSMRPCILSAPRHLQWDSPLIEWSIFPGSILSKKWNPVPRGVDIESMAVIVPCPFNKDQIDGLLLYMTINYNILNFSIVVSFHQIGVHFAHSSLMEFKSRNDGPGPR